MMPYKAFDLANALWVTEARILPVESEQGPSRYWLELRLNGWAEGTFRAPYINN